MRKDIILPLSIFLSAILISCVVVYDKIDTENSFSGEESISLTVEIICGSGINEVAGTGFIIKHDNEFIILSNSHVVVTNGVGNKDIYATLYNSDERHPLDLISFDESLDIAILKFRDYPVATSLEFSDSMELRYGQTVYSIGNSMGYGLSLSKGIISVPLVNIKYSENERLMIQTDIGLNRGGSGGPLFDENGKVVGMMTFRLSSNESIIQGMSYAIPSSVIIHYLDSQK